MEDISLASPEELFTLWEFKALKILLIIFVALVAYLTIKVIIRRLVKKIPQKRLTTIFFLLNSIVGFVITVVAGLIILSELQINITPILASAGIVGLAVGFGAQTLVRDLIIGIFILAEDQVRVGDIVKIKDFEGEVERVGLRTISIRDFSGNLIQFPNSEVQALANSTRDWSQVDLKIGVSTKHSIDEVLKTIQDVAGEFAKNKQLAEKLLAPPEILGVEEIAGNKMTIRVAIKTKPKKQFNISRQFLYEVKKAFEEKSIEFA